MSANVYEGLFILDSGAYASDATGTSGLVEAIIKKHDGELLASRLWDEKKLAYPIAGHRKGTYWLTYFRAAGDSVGKMERELQITDQVLRSMIVKLDGRIVDALVSHARGESVEAPEEDKATEKAAAKE